MPSRVIDATGLLTFVSGESTEFKTVTKFDKSISGLNKTWWKYSSYAASYSSDLADKENFTYKNLSIFRYYKIRIKYLLKNIKNHLNYN